MFRIKYLSNIHCKSAKLKKLEHFTIVSLGVDYTVSFGLVLITLCNKLLNSGQVWYQTLSRCLIPYFNEVMDIRRIKKQQSLSHFVSAGKVVKEPAF